MTLQQWNDQVTMLQDLRSKFDEAFANTRRAEQDGCHVYLTRKELFLLCETCSQRAMMLNRGDFEYKGYRGNMEMEAVVVTEE